MARNSVTSDVFTAVAEPRRRQIIDLLSRRRLCVTAIVMAVGLPQPAVSKHLSVLRKVGIVSVSQQGQQRMYELNFDQLRPIYDWVNSYKQHWERQLDRIKLRAEQRASALAKNTGRTNPKKGTS